MEKFRSNNRRDFKDRSSGRFRNKFESRDSGESRGFRDRPRQDKFSKKSFDMHSAICNKCKKQCQVPFKPTGNKPILCSDCFRKNNNRGNDFSPRNKTEQSGISQEQFSQINAKLDKILNILKELEISEEEIE